MTNSPAPISLTVPLDRQKLGLTNGDHEMAQVVQNYIEGKNGRVKDTLAALLAVHKNLFGDDQRKLHEIFREMTVKVIHEGGDLSLAFNNIPRSAVVLTPSGWSILQTQIGQISDAIRDLCIPLNHSSDDISDNVHSFVERTGVLNVATRPRTFIWGGHRSSQPEYDYAKAIGYHDAVANGTEFTTGCGPGIMKAPLKGALSAYLGMGLLQQRNFIGFTEQGIVRAEAPNALIDLLVIFPDIRKRIEAFIRASHRGRVHPGGFGTLEEILTFLGMKSDEKNEGMYYPFDLVEQAGGTYMTNVVQFIRTCFGNVFDKHFQLHVGESPQNYAEYVMQTNQPITSMWNHDLHVPTEIQEDWDVSFETIESIDLTSNQSPSRLIMQLVRFFSAMVDITIKKPEILVQWGSQRPRINGDPKIISATTELCQRMIHEKRIPESFKSLPVILRSN